LYGMMSDCVIRPVSVWCLPSQFRLLQVCESRQHQGSLEGIDALLGLWLIRSQLHRRVVLSFRYIVCPLGPYA